jgi:hypothetical protein
MRWSGHAARMGKMRNAYKILVGRSEWKRPFERSRRRCDNVKANVKELRYNAVILCTKHEMRQNLWADRIYPTPTLGVGIAS